MIIALEAMASKTSEDLTSPTPECTNLILTLSLGIFSNESTKASNEPCTSAFIIKFNVLIDPA